MKKIALLLLMFVAFQVSAQDFHFLPKIGLNLANMTNSDGSMKPGLNVGVYTMAFMHLRDHNSVS